LQGPQLRPAFRQALQPADAIHHYAPRPHLPHQGLHLAAGFLQVCQAYLWAGHQHTQQVAPLQVLQVPAQRAGIAVESLGKLLKGQEDPRLPVLDRAVVDELEAQGALAGTGSALHQVARLREEAPAQHVVQPGYAGEDPVLGPARL